MLSAPYKTNHSDWFLIPSSTHMTDVGKVFLSRYVIC